MPWPIDRDSRVPFARPEPHQIRKMIKYADMIKWHDNSMQIHNYQLNWDTAYAIFSFHRVSHRNECLLQSRVVTSVSMAMNSQFVRLKLASASTRPSTAHIPIVKMRNWTRVRWQQPLRKKIYCNFAGPRSARMVCIFSDGMHGEIWCVSQSSGQNVSCTRINNIVRRTTQVAMQSGCTTRTHTNEKSKFKWHIVIGVARAGVFAVSRRKHRTIRRNIYSACAESMTE